MMSRNWFWTPALTRTLLLLVGVLSFSGCDVADYAAKLIRFEGVATAAGERTIETFVITVSTFKIETDDEPDVEIKDEVTVYSGFTGRLRYTPPGGTEQIVDLNTDDKVIERPMAGTVTVIHDKD